MLPSPQSSQGSLASMLSMGKGGGVRSEKSQASQKKTQSALKSNVATFGKVLSRWHSDVRQLFLLLHNLGQLCGTADAIRMVIHDSHKDDQQLTHMETYSNDITNMDVRKKAVSRECRNGWGLNSRKCGSHLLQKFPSAGPIMLSLIFSDVSAVIVEIRRIIRGLGDVSAALKMTLTDAIKIVTGEDPNLFLSPDTIFTADHVADMTTLFSQHEKGIEIILIFNFNVMSSHLISSHLFSFFLSRDNFLDPLSLLHLSPLFVAFFDIEKNFDKIISLVSYQSDNTSSSSVDFNNKIDVDVGEGESHLSAIIAINTLQQQYANGTAIDIDDDLG